MPIAIVVLTAYIYTVGIADMFVHKKLTLIKPPFSAKAVTRNASSALDLQWITAPAVKRVWFLIASHVLLLVPPITLSTNGTFV